MTRLRLHKVGGEGNMKKCLCYSYKDKKDVLHLIQCDKCGNTSPDREWAKRMSEIHSMHKYLDYHYGKPTVCEHCKKEYIGKSKMDWALKKDRTYSRNKKDYFRLCRSCHRKYDLTEEKKKKAIENLWWMRGIKNPGKLNVKNLLNRWKHRKDNNEK